MPRPHHPDRSELTDAGKRDLIARIPRGKPLPDQYRFLLFADKREVERVGSDKTRAVGNLILPFQTLEQIASRGTWEIAGFSVS